MNRSWPQEKVSQVGETQEPGNLPRGQRFGDAPNRPTIRKNSPKKTRKSKAIDETDAHK
jgi:hypothetical protein